MRNGRRRVYKHVFIFLDEKINKHLSNLLRSQRIIHFTCVAHTTLGKPKIRISRAENLPSKPTYKHIHSAKKNSDEIGLFGESAGQKISEKLSIDICFQLNIFLLIILIIVRTFLLILT